MAKKNPLEILKSKADKGSTMGHARDRNKYNEYKLSQESDGKKAKSYQDWLKG
jgi:hypothetical protein